MPLSKKIIITGGPGTGKTSIIDGLAKKGYTVLPEKARIVIQKQLRAQTNKLPWMDVKGFSILVAEEILLDKDKEGLVFMDRGIVDIEAYMQLANVDYDKNQFLNYCKTMNYERIVFHAPFWEEIYATDSERKESKEEAFQISTRIKSLYIERGFDLIDIPKNSLEKRIDFVLSRLNLS